jgi:O-antigen/teichoic acid export membrane protein
LGLPCERRFLIWVVACSLKMNPEAAKEETILKAEEGSLTRRAGLTFVSNFLQQAARFLVGFAVTPIVIRGLGVQLYGAWMMMQQTMGYLALSDLRPMGTLKFTLAVRQHIDDAAEKRRQIGAALLIWAVTFPLLLALGAGAVWGAPLFIRTAPEHIWAVRVAMAVLVLTVGLERLFSLPGNVLRGMNLDYKAMGLNAATILLGGILVALAIWGGWGLPGVAAASLAGIVLSSAVRFLIARRVFPWFGVARPTRNEFLYFLKLSGWLFISALSSLLLVGSDLLIIGLILGPSAVAIYATTGAVLRLTMGPVAQLLGSGSSGIAGLCGQGDWTRVAKVRTEMHVVGIGVMSIIGAGVLALNEPFLQLWVGEGFYAGNITNFLLVMISLVMILFRIDGVIIDSLLQFRPKAIAMVLSGSLLVLSGGSLTYIWGLAGMALSVFLAYIILLVYFHWLINSRVQISPKEYFYSIMRPITLACFFFLIAITLSPFLRMQSWISFLSTAGLFTCIGCMLIWFLGFNPDKRKSLSRRVNTLFSDMAI